VFDWVSVSHTHPLPLPAVPQQQQQQQQHHYYHSYHHHQHCHQAAPMGGRGKWTNVQVQCKKKDKKNIGDNNELFFAFSMKQK